MSTGGWPALAGRRVSLLSHRSCANGRRHHVRLRSLHVLAGVAGEEEQVRGRHAYRQFMEKGLGGSSGSLDKLSEQRERLGPQEADRRSASLDGRPRTSAQPMNISVPGPAAGGTAQQQAAQLPELPRTATAPSELATDARHFATALPLCTSPPSRQGHLQLQPGCGVSMQGLECQAGFEVACLLVPGMRSSVGTSCPHIGASPCSCKVPRQAGTDLAALQAKAKLASAASSQRLAVRRAARLSRVQVPQESRRRASRCPSGTWLATARRTSACQAGSALATRQACRRRSRA